MFKYMNRLIVCFNSYDYICDYISIYLSIYLVRTQIYINIKNKTNIQNSITKTNIYKYKLCILCMIYLHPLLLVVYMLIILFFICWSRLMIGVVWLVCLEIVCVPPPSKIHTREKLISRSTKFYKIKQSI